MPVAAFFAAVGACLCLSACHHVDPAANEIGLTVWSVPAGKLQARIQVRLAAHTDIGTASLEATSANKGVTITPDRFTLHDLQPPAYPHEKTHNPPALGKTTLRGFSVQAAQPGEYPITIRLLWNGHTEIRRLTLHFPGGHPL